MKAIPKYHEGKLLGWQCIACQCLYTVVRESERESSRVMKKAQKCCK